MFEGILVESQGFAASGTKRWTALGSVVLQCGIAGILIAIPLMHPEVLPMISDPPRLSVPVPKPPPVPVTMETAASSSTVISVPSVNVAPVANARELFVRPVGVDVGPAPVLAMGPRMGDGTAGSLLDGIGPAGAPNITATQPKAPGRVNVSSGVVAGMLKAPIVPVYPAIAKATRTEGTVVIEAVISKAGKIESLNAISGPQILRRAALDAVQGARYEPYRLNGEATEVQTTITVVFRLAN